MAQEQLQRRSRERQEEEVAESIGEVAAASTTKQIDYDAIDDLLDSIDELLETDAEEFVAQYQQRGGQ
jgi:ubiquitin-like protein Pup